MYYAYKYRLKPSDAHREELDRHRDICRQLYNHTLYRLSHLLRPKGRSLSVDSRSGRSYWSAGEYSPFTFSVPDVRAR